MLALVSIYEDFWLRLRNLVLDGTCGCLRRVKFFTIKLHTNWLFHEQMTERYVCVHTQRNQQVNERKAKIKNSFVEPNLRSDISLILALLHWSCRSFLLQLGLEHQIPGFEDLRGCLSDFALWPQMIYTLHTFNTYSSFPKAPTSLTSLLHQLIIWNLVTWITGSGMHRVP